MQKELSHSDVLCLFAYLLNKEFDIICSFAQYPLSYFRAAYMEMIFPV